MEGAQHRVPGDDRSPPGSETGSPRATAPPSLSTTIDAPSYLLFVGAEVTIPSLGTGPFGPPRGDTSYMPTPQTQHYHFESIAEESQEGVDPAVENNAAAEKEAAVEKETAAEKEATAEKIDARIDAKIPESHLKPPPEDEGNFTLGFVSETVGYGLFAARNFSKGDLIFSETPILTARFSKNFGNHQHDFARRQLEEYERVFDKHGDALVAAFPQLAGQLGYPPHSWDIFLLSNPNLSLRLRGKQHYAGSILSKEHYQALMGSAKVAKDPGNHAKCNAMSAFFRYYSFQAPIPGEDPHAKTAAPQDRDAYVYLLASLTNHCCPKSKSGKMKMTKAGEIKQRGGPNCRFRIGPEGLVKFPAANEIVVEAIQDISAGDQLTWDYGRKESEFACVCETCVPSNFVLDKCRLL